MGETHNYKSNFFLGIVSVGGMFIGFTLANAIFPENKVNIIPNTKEVQSGYIAPSNLKIRCEDLDGNNELETIMRVNEKSYLLKYDEQGDPIILSYKIKMDYIE